MSHRSHAAGSMYFGLIEIYCEITDVSSSQTHIGSTANIFSSIEPHGDELAGTEHSHVDNQRPGATAEGRTSAPRTSERSQLSPKKQGEQKRVVVVNYQLYYTVPLQANSCALCPLAAEYECNQTISKSIQ